MSDTIVAVEPDPRRRHWLRSLLTATGYRALLVAAFPEAVGPIRREYPCLVLLDHSDQDPIAPWLLVQQLRRDPLTRMIPVIITTDDRRLVADLADALQRLRIEAIVQPFAPDDLLARIRGIQRQRPLGRCCRRRRCQRRAPALGRRMPRRVQRSRFGVPRRSLRRENPERAWRLRQMKWWR